MLEGFQEVSDRDFYEKVMSSETPSVVVFTSPYNPHNETVLNLLKRYVEEYSGKLNFFYLDVTKNTSFEDFGIFNFPAILYFRDTMEIERHDFIPSEEMVDHAIKRILRMV